MPRLKVFYAHSIIVSREWGDLVGAGHHKQIDVLAYALNRADLEALMTEVGDGYLAKHLKTVTSRSTSYPGNQWDAFTGDVRPERAVYLMHGYARDEVWRVNTDGSFTLMGSVKGMGTNATFEPAPRGSTRH